MDDKIITITESELKALCDEAIDYCRKVSCLDCYLVGNNGCTKKILLDKILVHQPKKPESWKFAMPADRELKNICESKLKKLGFIVTGYNYINCTIASFKCFNGFENYKHAEGKELTLSKFLALPEPQPKKPLPEWVKKGKFVLVRYNDLSCWQISTLENIDKENFKHPFIVGKLKHCLSMIAPAQEEFFLEQKQHPEQITAEDLINYDIEAWR